jgi:DNA polymerase I
MPGVVRWVAETKAFVLKNHYIETPLGRVRNFPEIAIARSAGDRERIFREAVNNNPQSVASDVTLRAFTKLDALGYDMRITVHDSVVAQAPQGDVKDVAREMCRIMEESATELLGDDLPFPADAGVGPTWGDIKEIDV